MYLNKAIERKKEKKKGKKRKGEERKKRRDGKREEGKKKEKERKEENSSGGGWRTHTLKQQNKSKTRKQCFHYELDTDLGQCRSSAKSRQILELYPPNPTGTSVH